MSRATIIASVILALPMAARANDLPFFGEATFGITAAAQAFDARTDRHPHRNKFDEHSHTPEGFALDELFVAAANERTKGFLSVRVLDAAQDDARFDVDAGQFGVWRAEAFFHTIPTRFSHSTQTPFAHLGHGRLVIDEAIRRDLESAPEEEIASRVGGVMGAAPFFEIATRRNSLGATGFWRATDRVELRVSVRDEARNGSKPFSLGSFDLDPDGYRVTLFEFAEPIEIRTNEATTGMTIRGRDWHIDLDATASRFRNTIAFIDYDNPFRATHAAATDDGLSGRMRAARGHVTSAPNTTGRSLRASGAFALGERATVGASVMWSGITQDQRFVPWTLNLAIPGSGLPEGLGPTNAEALPRPSLQGAARILSTDDSLALILTSDLTLTLRYRDYDFNSRTPDLEMPGYAGDGDGTWRTELDGEPVVARGISFRRQSAQSDLVWNKSPLRVRVSHERETRTRDQHEALRTTQDLVTGSLQWRGKEWNGRVMGRYALRSEAASAAERNAGHDTGDLRRADAVAFAAWMPSDRLSLTASVNTQISRYPGSNGLRNMNTHDVHTGVRFLVDESLEVNGHVSLNAMSYDYMHDDVWGRSVRDGSAAAGFDVLKTLGRVTATAAWEVALGEQRITVTDGAESERRPAVRTVWQVVDAGVELELTPRWRSGLRYRYAPFSIDDFATDHLSVYPAAEIAATTDARRAIFLDARYAEHEVHVLALYFRLISD